MEFLIWTLPVSQHVDISTQMTRLIRTSIRIPVAFREHVHIVEYDTVHVEFFGQLESGVHDSAFIEEAIAVLKIGVRSGAVS